MGMGGGFWEMMKPVCNRSDDLYSLRGKRLAIDLSFWIVQQESALKDKARKPHLRLLFFRVITLVAKVGAFPVFVVDGDAPQLKLSARIERFSRMSGVPADQLKGSGNSRNQTFLDNVEECVELLKLLGVPVLRAKGEAEALCAQLQREGVVDACVTPDSDAFLHGAECVIQTLQADLKVDFQKIPSPCNVQTCFQNPLVETYLASEILTKLELGREHLIALALLVGCDYNSQGIPGIGYAKAMRVVRCFPEDRILEQLRRWGRSQFPSSEEIKRMSNDGLDVVCDTETLSSRKELHCSLCGHPGTRKLHTKLACKDCGSEAGCVQKLKGFECSCKSCSQTLKRKKDERDVNWWGKLCARISATQGFPNEQIINLFLTRHSHLAETQSVSEFEWHPPTMELLEPFLAFHLHWNVSYIRQKVLPLLSHFCLKSMAENLPAARLIDGRFTPSSIERIKVDRGRQFYLLNWKAVNGSEDTTWLNQPGAGDKLFNTVEEMTRVSSACPDLVLQFEEKQELHKSKKVSNRIKKTKQQPDSKQKSIKSFFKMEKTPPPTIIEVDSDDNGSEARNFNVRRRLL